MCSRCRAIDAIEGQRWCRGCFAAYKRTARIQEISREVRKARLTGHEEMRILVIGRFEEYGGTEFNGRSVAEIVRQLRLD